MLKGYITVKLLSVEYFNTNSIQQVSFLFYFVENRLLFCFAKIMYIYTFLYYIRIFIYMYVNEGK